MPRWLKVLLVMRGLRRSIGCLVVIIVAWAVLGGGGLLHQAAHSAVRHEVYRGLDRFEGHR